MNLLYNLTTQDDSTYFDSSEDDFYEYFENITNSSYIPAPGSNFDQEDPVDSYFNRSLLSSLFLNDDHGHYSLASDRSTLGGGLRGKTLLSQKKKDEYKKALLDLIRNPDLAATLFGLTPPNSNSSSKNRILPSNNSSRSLDHLGDLFRRRDDAGRTVLIILAYSVIICVSLFGNFLVCHVVIRTRRLHTVTNSFLTNLAVSDLLMTALNIPFNVARVLLDDWPFGSLMCYVVPYVQVTSVYVSAFTMVAIALDRYQVIVHPLKPRLTKIHGAFIIGLVWVLAGVAAIPHALYNEITEVFTYRKMIRCQARYPQPALTFRKWLTLGTFLVQYAFPLAITLVAYICVSQRVWWRSVVGAATKQQVYLHVKAKRKTVKMLLVVVFVFAICWLPLNTYHLAIDFNPVTGPNRHSSSIFFLCHWFAMSSVCYNPFIYSWLNDHFKAGAKEWISCLTKKVCRAKNQTDTDYEQNMIQSYRPRDSMTISSSTYGGTTGCTIRSGSRSDSMRSKTSTSHSHVHSATVSEIHVPLDELLNTSASKSFKKPINISRKSSKKKLSFRASSSSVSSASSSNKAYPFPVLSRGHDELTKVVTTEDRCLHSPIPSQDLQPQTFPIIRNKRCTCNKFGISECNNTKYFSNLDETYSQNKNKAFSCKCHQYGVNHYLTSLKYNRLHWYRHKNRKDYQVSKIIKPEIHSKTDNSFLSMLSVPDKVCHCTYDKSFIHYTTEKEQNISIPLKSNDPIYYLSKAYNKNELNQNMLKKRSCDRKHNLKVNTSPSRIANNSKLSGAFESISLPILDTIHHREFVSRRRYMHNLFTSRTTHSSNELASSAFDFSRSINCFQERMSTSTYKSRKEGILVTDFKKNRSPKCIQPNQNVSSSNKLNINPHTSYTTSVQKSRSVCELSKKLGDLSNIIHISTRSSSTPPDEYIKSDN